MGDPKETHIQHMFDSFCKKVVRNEAFNIQKKMRDFASAKFQWRHWNKKA